MQTVEAARNPAKESPGKSAYPQKTSSPTGRKESIKWEPGKRRTYYCFQGGSFEDGFSGGYIWAPCVSESGRKFHYWDRLKELKEGDMIFHAARGRIRAVSIVKKPCVVAARPGELVGAYADDHHGYLVYCDYNYIENPISAWDYTEQTKAYSHVKYAPFNENGTGNLGYLYELD